MDILPPTFEAVKQARLTTTQFPLVALITERSPKEPKNCGFLDGFMQARGLKGGGSNTQGGGDSSSQAKMLGGMGGTMSQLASGLAEQQSFLHDEDRW